VNTVTYIYDTSAVLSSVSLARDRQTEVWTSFSSLYNFLRFNLF